MNANKSIIQCATVVILLLSLLGCSPSLIRRRTPPSRFETIRNEKPRSILLLPPIGNNLKEKDRDFISTHFSMILSEKGYYVISPAMAKREMSSLDAADPEWYIDNSARPLYPKYGVDAVMVIRVRDWSTMPILASRRFEVSCLLKSIHSDEVLYESTIANYETNLSGDYSEPAFAVISDMLYYLLTSKRSVAREGMRMLISELPDGPYAPNYTY